MSLSRCRDYEQWVGHPGIYTRNVRSKEAMESAKRATVSEAVHFGTFYGPMARESKSGASSPLNGL